MAEGLDWLKRAGIEGDDRRDGVIDRPDAIPAGGDQLQRPAEVAVTAVPGENLAMRPSPISLIPNTASAPAVMSVSGNGSS